MQQQVGATTINKGLAMTKPGSNPSEVGQESKDECKSIVDPEAGYEPHVETFWHQFCQCCGPEKFNVYRCGMCRWVLPEDRKALCYVCLPPISKCDQCGKEGEWKSIKGTSTRITESLCDSCALDPAFHPDFGSTLERIRSNHLVVVEQQRFVDALSAAAVEVTSGRVEEWRTFAQQVLLLPFNAIVEILSYLSTVEVLLAFRKCKLPGSITFQQLIVAAEGRGTKYAHNQSLSGSAVRMMFGGYLDCARKEQSKGARKWIRAQVDVHATAHRCAQCTLEIEKDTGLCKNNHFGKCPLCSCPFTDKGCRNKKCDLAR